MKQSSIPSPRAPYRSQLVPHSCLCHWKARKEELRGRNLHCQLKSGFRIHVQNFIMENWCTSDYSYSGSRSSSSHRRKWGHKPPELIADCRRTMRTAWSLPRSKQTPSHPSMFADFIYEQKPSKEYCQRLQVERKDQKHISERHLSLE